MMRKAVLIVLILVCCLRMIAQNELVFNRLSTAEGLATNKIRCAVQDEKGFLWIGHENGLQRYDGRKFVHFYRNITEQQLPPKAVDELHLAGSGKLWVRQGNDIGLFDRNSQTYSKVNWAVNGNVQPAAQMKIFTDSRQRTFLVIYNAGLLLYDSVSNSFSQKNVPIQTPAGWPINNLYEDKKTGNYWICSDSGLAVYQTRNKQLYSTKHNPLKNPLFEIPGIANVRDFVIDHNNNYWIAFWRFKPVETGTTIIQYDPLRQRVISDTSFTVKPGNVYTEVRQLLIANNGSLWAGGTNALFNYDNATKTFFQHRKSNPYEFQLNCRTVFHLLEDRESNLWLSTDNGLFVSSPANEGIVNIIFSNRGDKEVLVQSILETKKAETWVGTWGVGLVFLDENGKLNIPTPVSGKPGEDQFTTKVWDIHQNTLTSDVWVTFHAGRIGVVDPVTKKMKAYVAPPVFENQTIRHIQQDNQGNLWFSTLSGRLVKHPAGAPVSASTFELVQKFGSAIQKFLIDKQQRLWLGTVNDGIYVLDPYGRKQLYHFNHDKNDENSAGSNKVFDIVQYNDSTFFAGAGGLNIITLPAGTITRKTIYDGLPGTVVSQLATDANGQVWIINNNGLCSYNPAKNTFTPYNQKDGIVSAARAGQAKCIKKNGQIWFGGESVLFGFTPASLKANGSPPAVSITDFKLFNTFLLADSLLQLPTVSFKHTQHSFAIYFSALNFTQQDKLNYYYMLEGIDKDWVFADRSLEANYTIIPPGNYKFKVRCENSQGQYSAITSLPISIAAPFYNTWWFITLLIAAAAYLIYYIYRLNINRLLAVEKLRNKVARDLHDDMGSTLSTINILSTMAKTRMHTNSVQASEYITKISDNSQRMMEAMDDIVWSIKPDNDTMQKITGRMREFATNVLEAKDILLNFKVDEKVKDVRLNMEARRDFFLIFKEAINNIAKYAHCTQVQVVISCTQKALNLSIVDDGVGFNTKDADTGNGLGNMQKRAEALHAGFQVESSPGMGTKVKLQIPLR